jgi:hypothetical protein
MLIVIVLVAIAVWMYLDARARGAKQPALWAIGAVLLAIVVVPVWLIKRGPKTDAAVGMKRCPFCAEAVQDAAIVCKHCARDIAARMQTS